MDPKKSEEQNKPKDPDLRDWEPDLEDGPEDDSPAEKNLAEKRSIKKRPDKPAKKPIRPLDPTLAYNRAMEAQNRILLNSAAKIANRIQARMIFIIIDDPSDCKIPETIAKRKDVALVAPERSFDDDFRKHFKEVLTFPRIMLSRMGKIKMAMMKSLSARLIGPGDKIVCVTGSRGLSSLDSLVIVDIGMEFELMTSSEVSSIATQVRSEIFEELITIATEIAGQGREGKPVGAIFVLGDSEKVLQISRQMIFNPFLGYPEEERNILDPKLRDTVREFSSLDGAFVIRDDGVILAAGRHLNAVLEDESLPRGLGARHAAAAGITSVTSAIAIVISESTGIVRIFKGGKIFMEIEKASQPAKR